MISHYLGVGYTTLIYHMHLSLGLLPFSKANELLKSTPKQIKQQLMKDNCSTDLIVVDRYWSGKAIDVSVDDYTGKQMVFRYFRL